MSDVEKKAAETLANAFNALPENKREFLIGYAEGVAAMVEKQDKERLMKEQAL